MTRRKTHDRQRAPGAEMFHMEHPPHRRPAGPAGPVRRAAGGLQQKGEPDRHHHPRGHRGPALCRQPAAGRPARVCRPGGGCGDRRRLPRRGGQDLQARPGPDPDGAHRQAGGVPAVSLRRTGADRGGVRQRAGRGSRPQRLAGVGRPGGGPGGGRAAGALRILPAAGKAGRAVHRHEGPRRRRRVRGRRRRPAQTGGPAGGMPELYPARR